MGPPARAWPRGPDGRGVAMYTRPLDVAAMLREA